MEQTVADPTSQPAGADAEQPAGDLVKQATEQASTLIRQEVRLAQVELQEKGKRAGIGAGMFGASGLVALYGLAFVFAAAAFGLATIVADWLAALIIGVLLLAVAGALSLRGKKEVEKATPPAPKQAIDSTKRDVETVKGAAKR